MQNSFIRDIYCHVSMTDCNMGAFLKANIPWHHMSGTHHIPTLPAQNLCYLHGYNFMQVPISRLRFAQHDRTPLHL